MHVTIHGARGSLPTPGAGTVRFGGETTCVAIASDGEAPGLILDAGSGLRGLSRRLDGRGFRGAVVLTHLHWDHVCGLPFFAAGDRPDSRLDVYVPEQGVPAADLISRIMGPPYFPIGPQGLRGEWTFQAYGEQTFAAGGVEITAREVPHSTGRTMGLRIDDGRSRIAFVPDHAPHFAGTGDNGAGALHPAIVELADGVDLLIHDAQYQLTELPARWTFGHAAAEYAVELAERCRVGRLLLFHHDPARDDDAVDEILHRMRASTTIPVDAAIEGTTIRVG